MLGTRGGPTRLQIINALSKRPYNANQLATIIHIDYKTVKHHMGVLLENSIVSLSKEKRYGELYHLTEYAKSKLGMFDSIIKKLG